MDAIIAGCFRQEHEAKQAITELLRYGFPEDEISVFFVNPPRLHAARPLDEMGDDDESAPDRDDAQPVRAAGMMVAALAPSYAKRICAVNVLRAAGAQDIERADGTWRGGKWADFNPLSTPQLVDLPQRKNPWTRSSIAAVPPENAGGPRLRRNRRSCAAVSISTRCPIAMPDTSTR